jgi:hypothetical protein
MKMTKEELPLAVPPKETVQVFHVKWINWKGNETPMTKRIFQQSLSDVKARLSKLQSGIDINVKFSGVSDFGITPEFTVFNLLLVKLFYGWIVERDINEPEKFIQKSILEKLLSDKSYDRTSIQLTYQGHVDLNSEVKNDELAVLFRNIGFSTIFKTNDQLFTLLTDQDFLRDDTNIIMANFSR